MEKQKGVKKINLFSSEGRDILSQIVQERLNDVLDQSESAVRMIDEERRETSRIIGCDPHCHSCDVTFTTREEQVEHYKLDWHRHNLKRKLKCLPSLSEEGFECQSGTGDLSSISGSDSDSNDDNVTMSSNGSRIEGSPLLLFNTPDSINHAIYRCLVCSPKDSRVTTEVDLSKPLSILTLSPPKVWIILMRSGGHFAGAVFKGCTVVGHKTFHRYTVRAKQGTMQSSKDSHSGGHKPKSAGASLRRYNEAALEQEISDLLLSWRQYTEDASLIFIRAPKHQRMTITSGKTTIIDADDPRIRTVPFMTRRPTFSEIKSVQLKLSTIYTGVQSPQAKTKPHHSDTKKNDVLNNKDNYLIDKVNEWQLNSSPDTEEDTINTTTKKKKKQKKKLQQQQQQEHLPAEEVDPVIKSLHDLITLGDVDQLQHFLVDNDIKSVDHQSDVVATNNININLLYQGSTALHLAATCGHGDIVYTLLSHGADPSIKDCNSKVSYLLCKDRSARDSFRRFKGHYPTVYNYTVALIPSPLTEELEEARKEKKSEKKKIQKKAQKQKKKVKAAEEELISIEEERKSLVSGLSDREKRAMAAEKRLTGNLPPGATDITKFGVCSWCGHTLCGVVPFEKLNYKYCRMECVREHRQQLLLQKPN